MDVRAEIDLQDRTNYYWQLQNEKEARDYYLKKSFLPSNPASLGPPLFQLETGYILSFEDRLPSYGDEDTKEVTLVILVGESFEPLLQSIWAHKPTKILPIVNKYYGDSVPGGNQTSGKTKWKQLLSWIKLLPNEIVGRVDQLPTRKNIELVADSPTAVFEYLRDNLRTDLQNRQVVIDITGAKKTMVAGAFLFAAYTNSQIYYVDSKRYNEHGKPYGYSCWFRKVENPLNELSLKIWQNIADLYTRYDFSGALRLLDTLSSKASVDYEENTQQLRLILKICYRWDNGHLREARELTNDLPDNVDFIPTVIKKAGCYWPNQGSSDTRESAKFFQDIESVLVYAQDELIRIQRLAGIMNTSDGIKSPHNYRAAFARAYALHETLLKATAVLLFRLGKLIVQKKKQPDTLVPTNAPFLPNNFQKDGVLWLVNKQAGDIRSLLMNTELMGGLQVGQETYQVCPEVPIASIYLPDQLKNHRNIITHSYYPAHHDLVQRAYALAERNFNYYKQLAESEKETSAETKLLQNSQFTPPKWQELKQICQLYFIPDEANPNSEEAV